MGELSEGEPVTPIRLSVVNEDPEVLLDFLVHALCLPICLRMEHSGSIGCDIKHSVEFLHKLGDKLWAPIRDHSCWHSMSCVDVVTENLGPSLSREFDVASDGDDGFQESVYDHEEGIMPV